MSRTISFWLVSLAVGLVAFAVAAEEPKKSSSFEDEAYSARWLAWHDEQWKKAVQGAGQQYEGIVAEAVVVPPEPEIGKPVMFVVTYKNVDEQPAWHRQWEEYGPFEVLMRDDSSKPVPRSEKGRKAWRGIREGHSLPDEIGVKPGFAIAEKLPLDDYFDLSRPGKYTVLGWGAKPVTFELRRPGSKTSKTSSPSRVYRPDDPFGKRWQDALAAAGQPHDDLLLESIVSPIDRRAVNLVVSLRNVCTSGKIAPGWACSVSGANAAPWISAEDTSPGIDMKVGTTASEYRILVQDVSGKEVPLNEGAQRWQAGRDLTPMRPLRPGEAIGFVCPLHKMFALKAGQEYSVLVVLPGKANDDPAWISTPVKVRMPEPEVGLPLPILEPHAGRSQMRGP